MRIRIKEQRDIVAKAKGDLDIKQNELLNAIKKRKVLEKVKEKEWKRFKENIERGERILVDEVGMRKYQRGM
jgi:flagellar FliJ protein